MPRYNQNVTGCFPSTAQTHHLRYKYWLPRFFQILAERGIIVTRGYHIFRLLKKGIGQFLYIYYIRWIKSKEI